MASVLRFPGCQVSQVSPGWSSCYMEGMSMKPAILIVLVIIVIVAVVVVLRSRSRRMQHGEILPSKQMQEKYGLYAENRPDIKIDPMQVPENLRDLIPMAQKWGVSDDIIRSVLRRKVYRGGGGE